MNRNLKNDCYSIALPTQYLTNAFFILLNSFLLTTGQDGISFGGYQAVRGGLQNSAEHDYS